jgi:hypothetical protein
VDLPPFGGHDGRRDKKLVHRPHLSVREEGAESLQQRVNAYGLQNDIGESPDSDRGRTVRDARGKECGDREAVSSPATSWSR